MKEYTIDDIKTALYNIDSIMQAETPLIYSEWVMLESYINKNIELEERVKELEKWRYE